MNEEKMDRIEKALLRNVIPFVLGFVTGLIVICIRIA
jgi:hypothetical protein